MTTVPPGWPVPELPSPPPPPSRPEPHRPTPGFTFLTPPPSDVEDQLLRRRIVMLSGPLDPATAQAAAARLMLADADSPDPVELVVNCPDGDLAAAVMLTETVQLMRARVVATASGTVGGPALGVYAAARHRRAHPHARFAFSEPRATFAGTADRIEAETAMHRDQADFLTGVIAAAAGGDPAADARARRTLTAAEARDRGLVHELVTRG